MSFIDEKNEKSVAILRLLNGRFCGCEYHLTPGKLLFVVGDENDFVIENKMPSFPENTIVIPLADGGVNFEVDVPNDSSGTFRVKILENDFPESIHAFQEVCNAGPLSFSVRSVDTEWDDTVIKNVVTPISLQSKLKKSKIIHWSWLLILVVVLIGGTWSGFLFIKQDKKVTEIASVIQGANGSYQILYGRDGYVYVFSEKERDVSWARQALVRSGLSDSAYVRTYREEEYRISRLLNEFFPLTAIHRLKLIDAKQPVLIVSAERTTLTSDLQGSIKTKLAQWMPYSEKNFIESWSDSMLKNQAKTRLDRLGITYKTDVQPASVNYIVDGGINDVSLSQVKAMSDAFYQDYGTNYIHFAVELKDDWLKGKSFKYGPQGYVKMGKQHWYFPEPL